MTATIVPLTLAFALKVNVEGAADSAALAAADTLLGLFPGDPCERAADLAEVHGVQLMSCTIEGAEVRVRTAVTYLAFDVVANARAGPPRFDVTS